MGRSGYPDSGRASPSSASRGGLWEELAASNGPGLVLPTATVGADLSGTPHSGRTGCATRAVLRCGTVACVCGFAGESSGSLELRIRDSVLGGAGACGPLGACVAGGGRRAGAAGSLRPREWRVKN